MFKEKIYPNIRVTIPLCSLAFLVWSGRLFPASTNLLLKMPYEKKGVIRQLGDDYKAYKTNPKKVIPFIY